MMVEAGAGGEKGTGAVRGLLSLRFGGVWGSPSKKKSSLCRSVTV